MINNNTIDDSVRVSLIDTKALKKPQNFYCQALFKNCFLHLFSTKKEKNFAYINDESEISKSTDHEKHQSDSLEIHYNPKNDSKLIKKNIFTKYKVEDYTQNEIFILEGVITKKPILVKITEKNFQGDNENLDSPIPKLNLAHTESFILTIAQSEKIAKQVKKIPICFPNKSEQIKYNLDYLSVSDLPDGKFTDYLANRIEGNLIIDFTGGIGEYSIPVNL